MESAALSAGAGGRSESEAQARRRCNRIFCSLMVLINVTTIVVLTLPTPTPQPSTSPSTSSLAKHRIVTSGRCEDHELLAVTSLDGCSSAAAQLALSDTSATATSGASSTQSNTPLPPFCYIKPSNLENSQLYYNDHSGPGKCTNERSCICIVPSAAEAGSGTSADPVPALVTSGRCEDHGLLAVTSVDSCSSAAAQLALSDTSAEASSRGSSLQSGTPVPPFCYIKPCNLETHRLFYVYDHSGPGNCTSERVCICSGTPTTPSSAQTRAEAVCPYLPGAYLTSAQLGLNVECTFYCGNARLPGYPTDMSPRTGLHSADCSSIRADNCKSPCIELANELYAPQTWLGVIFAYFFIYNGFFTMKEKKFPFELTPTNLIKATFAGNVGATQEMVLIATILTGFCNAVIASWKLTSKFGSFLDLGRCFLPHPYDEGSVIFPTTLLVFAGDNMSVGFVAMLSGIFMMISSPQIITIVRQALVLPIMYWIARFGRHSQHGNTIFAFCALANFGTLFMTIFYAPMAIAIFIALGVKSAPLLLFVIYNHLARRLVFDGQLNFLRFWHKASAEEKRPIWLKDGWFSDKICPSRAEQKGHSKRLCEGNRTYFNYYLLLLVFFQYGVLLPNLAAYLLVTINNANDIRFMEMDWDALGNAFGSFFGKGLRIPQFYWAEYFGNFDTILGHMALAFGIDLFLLVQNVLPQAGSTVGRGIATV